MLSESLIRAVNHPVRFGVVTCSVYPSLALLTLSGLIVPSLASPWPVPRLAIIIQLLNCIVNTQKEKNRHFFIRNNAK